LQTFFENCALLSINVVPEQDWVRLTQSQFEPVPITPTFWVVPSWHEPPAGAQWVLRLDPGLAFGTGTHPTTRMCLKWIAEHPPMGQRVLDYGCGSGILAIGAAMLGAASVSAVDIDPDAVIAAQANAVANHVELNLGLPDTAWGQYPLVVANILAAPLKVLAPLLCSHVAAGGTLLLAGILDRQTEDIQAAYQPYLDLQVADTQEGWVLMRGQAV
jgi:ribosomal protein L11 methyltransferase